ncbi:MAG: adenosylcobinamide-GDP ribazoletransferase [Thermodesulfobacteriota bacterium]
MNHVLLVLQFLTVFPVRREIKMEPGEAARSMALFPFVGALQGGLLVASDVVLHNVMGLPVSVASAILLAILLLTSGGLHIDGFTDTVDGLAGGATPEDRLRIMRDGSAGAVGVAAVVLLLLIKYLCIAALPGDARAPALLLFPMVGRWSMVPMSFWGTYAREGEGLGKAFTGCPAESLLMATVVVVFLSGIFFGPAAFIVLAGIAAFTYGLTVFFKRRLGGITGDVFGFQSEAGEVLFLLAVLALAGA